MSITVHHADNREVLATLADNSIDAVVTDPPYALVSIQKRFGKPGAAPAKGDVYARASAGFMGKQWDTGEVAFAEEFWAQVWRVLKPGGHLVAFSGTRTYHRMVVAIEDAGFEIRDQLAWVYGSGFPKSHDVAKGIDKHLGFERAKVRVRAPKNPPNLVGGIGKGGSRPWVEKALEQGFHEAASPEAASPEAAIWSGYGTALKPSWEPICLARKPMDGTVAENVLRWGVGALNIDGCRIEGIDPANAKRIGRDYTDDDTNFGGGHVGQKTRAVVGGSLAGRWPANVVLSVPEHEYQLRPYATAEQRRELFGWLHENA